MNADVGIKDRLFYFCLIVSTVLYIYSINLWGINISLFRLLFLLWCAYFLKDVLLKKKRIKRSYRILYVLYILILAINLIDWVRIDANSLMWRNIINHIVNMSLVLLVVNYIDNEKKLDAVIRLYILGSLFTLYVSVFSFVTGKLPFEWLIRTFQSELRATQNLVAGTQDLSIFRGTSTFTDPSFYGLYICLVIVLCIYLYNYVEKRKYISVLMFLNIMALVTTMSRSAALGFVAIIVVAVLKVRRFWVKVVVKAVWLVPIIVCFSIFLSSNPEISRNISLLYRRYTDVQSFLERLPYLSKGLEVFAKNPIIGGGSQLLSHDRVISSAHVVYLSLLAKYGLVGFFIYSIFLLYPICYVVKNKNKLSEKYAFLIVAIYLPIFVMYLVYDYFEFLEFQYLIFGLVYSIIVNRIGISGGNRTFASGAPQERYQSKVEN